MLDQQRADVLLLVFGYLGWRERAVAGLVCKEWREQARAPSLWRRLDLRNSQRPRPVLAALAAHPHLKAGLAEVDLEFAAGVEDGDLAPLRGCPLTSLNLNGCQRLTPEAIAALVGACPRLARLGLYWNLRVTDAVLRTLGSACPALCTLSLSGCRHVTDAGVEALAQGCRHLVDLDLTRCLLLGLRSFQALAAHCPRLEVLRLYACVQVGDGDLEQVARLPRLRVLDICGTQEVTDKGLQALAAACPALESLNLTWVTRCTDAGLARLAQGCPSLRWLSLHGLLGITDATVAALAQHCRDTLTTLDVNGCRNIQRRSREELLRVLPKLMCFRVHS